LNIITGISINIFNFRDIKIANVYSDDTEACFTTYDVARIDVVKGFSSITSGAIPKDIKSSLKIGYTPMPQMSMASITSIHNKNSLVRYWEWLYWDKQSIYYISRTALDKKTDLKARAYFDQFKNKLSSFADNTYSMGIENVFKPVSRPGFIPGLSYNRRKSLKAEDFNSNDNTITNYPEAGRNFYAALYFNLQK
jgi:hypothetical protein